MPGVIPIAARSSRRRAPSPESGHARIQLLPLSEIQPSPENDELYRPISSDDPDLKALAASIKENGLKEPIVITLDGFIVSGHRRFAAARLAGLKFVPCRTEPISRVEQHDKFLALLREYNRQRNKTLAEKLREELVSVNPEDAYQSLIEHRERLAEVEVPSFHLEGTTHRARISAAKEPFLAAILKVINGQRKFWPLSDRRIHYSLLNDPPLRHASKRKSRYANNAKSYSDLTDLLTRARIEGRIPFPAIGDETRPVTTWSVDQEPSTFLRKELKSFLTGYWRDLMQSQPNHIEVVAEKNSIAPICRSICMKYCVPLTSGRGYCSLPPRYQMAQRYRKSGKQKLILLLVSDFDPDGEEIAHSFARSMRDDFEIEDVHPIKVALNSSQVEEYELPPLMQAKKSSSNHKKFVDKFGVNVWEVEALAPEMLQDILTTAIDSVLDLEAFNEELDSEREDSHWLGGVRRTVLQAMREADLDLPDEEADDDTEDEE